MNNKRGLVGGQPFEREPDAWVVKWFAKREHFSARSGDLPDPVDAALEIVEVDSRVVYEQRIGAGFRRKIDRCISELRDRRDQRLTVRVFTKSGVHEQEGDREHECADDHEVDVSPADAGRGWHLGIRFPLDTAFWREPVGPREDDRDRESDQRADNCRPVNPAR